MITQLFFTVYQRRSCDTPLQQDTWRRSYTKQRC